MDPTEARSVATAVVVIPTYNERDNIARLIRDVRALGYRVLVVDNGSPDGTGAIVDQLAVADQGVSCIQREKKSGIGPAYAAGFAHVISQGESTICQMDADYSHDPVSLPTLVEAIENGADLAIGSRYIAGGSAPDWHWIRRLISTGGNLYARTLLRVGIRDMTGGFLAWSRGGLAAADPGSSHASGYAFQVETAWRAVRAGCTVVEHPITFSDRVAGTSKMDLAIVLETTRLVTGWGIRRITGRLR